MLYYREDYKGYEGVGVHLRKRRSWATWQVLRVGALKLGGSPIVMQHLTECLDGQEN
jgi:hypothetical protein